MGRAMAAATPPAPPDRPLPATCTPLRAIFDNEAPAGTFVSVIGLVKDCQLPRETIGTDYKSTLELFDLSLQDETARVKFVIFRKLDTMPQVSAGDVIVAQSARVQRYRSDPFSLITHHRTSIRVYAASKIPKPPQSAQAALMPPTRQDVTALMPEEQAYVSHLYHQIDKSSVPDDETFQQAAAQSLNIKQKFSLLKDVQEGKFCDLVVQVAKEPHHGYDKTTLYVSDYTENPHFYSHVWPGLDGAASAAADPYGYTSVSADASKKDWFGPYGRMTLQVSCFEPHATYLRDEVRAGQWVSLRNVQIKFGNNGQHLEGFLRGERGVAYERKVNVNVLETNDREAIDPNLKEAIRRMRDYDKKRKQQIKEIKAGKAAGEKRSAFVALEQADRPLNTKDRRKRRRAAQGQQANDSPAIDSLRLELNDEVTAEVHNTPFSTIESILEPAMYETTINAQPTSLPLPFTCAKHRARVRVVDFFPRSLADFASARKPTNFDVLSDNEDDSDVSSSSSDDDGGGSAAGVGRIWEWRFALQLEDPAPPKPAGRTAKPAPAPPRLWVLVDNADAQCLTGLDAVDLRRDPQALAQLREKMFTLWGNLEECKARGGKAKTKEGGGQAGGAAGKKGRRQLEKPPLESSDEDEGARGGVEKGAVVSNKPFMCCIKQYGVKAEGGGEEGKEWVRCFGLFGTRIK